MEWILAQGESGLVEPLIFAAALVVAAAVDLAFRWLAFKTFDSIAVDIAIFALVFRVIEELTMPSDGSIDAFIFAILILILVTLVIYLVSLEDMKQRLVRHVIHYAANEVGRDSKTLEDFGVHSVQLALWRGKTGKARRRDEFAGVVNGWIHGGNAPSACSDDESPTDAAPVADDMSSTTVDSSTDQIISESKLIKGDDFLLPENQRRFAMFAFAALGFLSFALAIPW